MAIPNVNGFRVKKGNETGITKIATDAILDKAVTKAKLSQPVQTEINKVANKADQDGEYDSLTAGGAKQLLSTVYVDDNEPYNFRTAGGSADIGDRMYEEVVGGSIVWNQLFSNGQQSFTNAGVTATNNYDGSWTVNGTAESSSNITFMTLYKSNGQLKSNHVYFLSACPKNGSASTWYEGVAGLKVGFGNGGIYKHTYDWASTGLRFDFSQGVEFTNAIVHPQWIDLTQMFGSTIADYIYSLEQGTAGAGVAWFRKLFPKPYYEYNAGELMSVKAGSHDTVGFNQFDKSTAKTNHYANSTGVIVENSDFDCTDYIPCFPNTNYYTNCDVGGRIYKIVFFDASKSFVGIGESNAFTTPSTARYIVVNTAHSQMSIDDLVLNLAWDGERNGEYEPYEKHTYPLAELELRGIPKLDANNQLYYDGDTYASDGTVTRKYGIVDLSSLTWQTRGTGTTKVGYSAVAPFPYKCVPTSMPAATKPPFLCEKYSVLGNTAGQIITNEGPENLEVGIYGYQSNIPTDTFYAVLPVGTTPSGYMVYELYTPTTETADTFVNPQVVDDFGTEEYTDYAEQAGDRDVAIPVGHNSQYMNNLRAKLEMAPESPSGDGKYIVQQSNGENAYIPYTADGRLDAIEAKLPAPPSANGTYKLTATVTDGGVTYTWVAG